HAPLNAPLARQFSRRSFLSAAAALTGAALWPKGSVAAIPDTPASPLAFTNVRIFDGRSSRLLAGLRVVVEGNLIRTIEPANQPPADGIEIIDGGGRTLMPGLIDAHWHSMMA